VNQQKLFFGLAEQSILRQLHLPHSYQSQIQLNVAQLGDWFHFDQQALLRNKHSRMFLRYFRWNLLKTLQFVFPENHWPIWMFENVPNGYWENEKHVISYLKWISEEIQIIRMEDWYNISVQKLHSSKGSSILRKYGGLLGLLSRFFPDYPWDHKQFLSPRLDSKILGKEHIHLFNVIQLLFRFTEQEVFVNYEHHSLKYLQTHQTIEFDIFIPFLSTAFEYHGPAHYQWHFKFGSPEERIRKDLEKSETCHKNGITLVEIPFSWKGDIFSLLRIIQKSRPDLIPLTSYHFLFPSILHEKNEEIRKYNVNTKRENVDSHFPLSTLNLPSISTLINTSKLVNYKDWNMNNDLSKWWIFERLHGGIRALWDGKENLQLPCELKIKVPNELIKFFPKIPLDGELCNRTSELSFESLKDDISSWNGLQYRVFDTMYTQLSLEKRIDLLKSVISAREYTHTNSFVLLQAEIFRCHRARDLLHLLWEVTDRCATGLVFRRENSYYYETTCFLPASKEYIGKLRSISQRI